MLVLCDVDHALRETGGVTSELFHLAFQQATGRPIEHEVTLGLAHDRRFTEDASRWPVVLRRAGFAL